MPRGGKSRQRGSTNEGNLCNAPRPVRCHPPIDAQNYMTSSGLRWRSSVNDAAPDSSLVRPDQAHVEIQANRLFGACNPGTMWSAFIVIVTAADPRRGLHPSRALEHFCSASPSRGTATAKLGTVAFREDQVR